MAATARRPRAQATAADADRRPPAARRRPPSRRPRCAPPPLAVPPPPRGGRRPAARHLPGQADRGSCDPGGRPHLTSPWGGRSQATGQRLSARAPCAASTPDKSFFASRRGRLVPSQGQTDNASSLPPPPPPHLLKIPPRRPPCSSAKQRVRHADTPTVDGRSCRQPHPQPQLPPTPLPAPP